MFDRERHQGLVGVVAAGLTAVLFVQSGCAPRNSTVRPSDGPPPASMVTIASPKGQPRPPYTFSDADAKLLDEVQHGAFNFLWLQGSPERGVATGMAPDRTSKTTVSVAGVGFQLSGLCVGVERGWVTREQAHDRAMLILRSLAANPENKHAGLFYHFVDAQTAG